MDIYDFEDIRPFRDDEVEAAIQRILEEPLLYDVMDFIYPSLSRVDILEMMSEIKTVKQFQEEISGPCFKEVAQKTTSGLTFTNMNELEKDNAYLFLSNHRDIILDSALLNVSLLEKGYNTTQIAIGSNLLKNSIISDIVRVNKNFIVNRDINPRDLLPASQRLSNYIRKTIEADNTSIWIAHKEGRSKDGDDRTASGLLKMLTLSGDESIEKSLLKLNIRPMVVSYENDPCDVMKAAEIMSKRVNGSYEKHPLEDYKSMTVGLKGHKGKVNITVCPPITEKIYDLKKIDNKNDKIKELAAHIDQEMHKHFKLWPTNFMAYDLLHGGREFSNEYNPIQRIAFRRYMTQAVLKLVVVRKKLKLPREGFQKMAREVLLQMYAFPVQNWKEATAEKEQSIF
ncbi:MAG: 1-acyl-sn-glycerol-3-phosphate acyltransferase [Flavobacteriales bacterium]|jgi:1-acyl-sn-glycerol-3-phosphate acyltransferase